MKLILRNQPRDRARVRKIRRVMQVDLKKEKIVFLQFYFHNLYLATVTDINQTSRNTGSMPPSSRIIIYIFIKLFMYV